MHQHRYHPISPVVGIPICAIALDGQIAYATSARYASALLGGAGASAMLIPPMGPVQSALLDRIDGLLVPGSVSNVHPSRYGNEDSLTPDLHDPARDATTIPLIQGAVERGIPVLAICRGIQELNVALGGTLHQNVHEKPGRRDHGWDNCTPRDADFSPRHTVAVTGALARIVGASGLMVNSLHSQAIDRIAPHLVIEAVAEDRTIEAVTGIGTAGFVLGVQWHPEYRFAEDPASVGIFRAFGDACRRYRLAARKE